MGEKPDTGTKLDERRLDLSVPQVAGSALAAVAAAVLASRLGVYGTIVGAGVVSVVATCGGTVFQHLFRRTGEQLRDVTAQSLPRARRDPARPAYEDTRAGEFGAATVHGTRLRGWKRSSLGAAVVFAVAMGGITAYELASGAELGGGGGGTTVGSVVRGSGDGAAGPDKDSRPDRPASPAPGTGGEGDTSATPDPGGGTGDAPTPGASAPTSPSPSPTPSTGSGGASTGGTGSSGGTSSGGTPAPTPSPPSAPTDGKSPKPDPARPGTGAGTDAVPSP